MALCLSNLGFILRTGWHGLGITFAAFCSSCLSVSPLHHSLRQTPSSPPAPHCCHRMVPFCLPLLHPQYLGLNEKPPLPGLGLLSPTLPSLFLLAALLFSSWLVHLLEQVLELPCLLEGELLRVRGLPAPPLALTATLLLPDSKPEIPGEPRSFSSVPPLPPLGTLPSGPRPSGNCWLDVQGL